MDRSQDNKPEDVADELNQLWSGCAPDPQATKPILVQCRRCGRDCVYRGREPLCKWCEEDAVAALHTRLYQIVNLVNLLGVPRVKAAISEWLPRLTHLINGVQGTSSLLQSPYDPYSQLPHEVEFNNHQQPGASGEVELGRLLHVGRWVCLGCRAFERDLHDHYDDHCCRPYVDCMDSRVSTGVRRCWLEDERLFELLEKEFRTSHCLITVVRGFDGAWSIK